jgi:predicted RNA methylase
LIDAKRTSAFKNAIENSVKPGDIVVDMGTGTGVLAMFAAKMGAKKVYAIENDPKNVMTLHKTFKLNGYNNIVVIEGDVTKINLPEKVDVIIGEMIATALIEELQVPAKFYTSFS